MAFATASDVKALAIQVQGIADGLNAVFSNCAALDAATRSQWLTLYQSWTAFAPTAMATVIFDPWSKYDEVQSYQTNFIAWQPIAQSKCGSLAPTPAPTVTPGQGLIPSAGDASPFALSSSTKVLIGLGLAVVGLLAVAPLLAEAAASLSARRAIMRAPTSRRLRNPIQYHSTVNYRGIPIHLHLKDGKYCADTRAIEQHSPFGRGGTLCGGSRDQVVASAKAQIDHALGVRKPLPMYV